MTGRHSRPDINLRGAWKSSRRAGLRPTYHTEASPAAEVHLSPPLSPPAGPSDATPLGPSRWVALVEGQRVLFPQFLESSCASGDPRVGRRIEEQWVSRVEACVWERLSRLVGRARGVYGCHLVSF